MHTPYAKLSRLVLCCQAGVALELRADGHLAAVLDVLKIPNTRRRASSKACGAVMPPDQKI